MLIEYGYHTGAPDWQVDEPAPCGFVRVYAIVSGPLQCCFGGEQTTLVPGQLYLFPSAAPYRLRQRPEDPLICTYLHLNPAPALLHTVRQLPLPPDSFLAGLVTALTAAARAREDWLVTRLAELFEQYARAQALFSLPDDPIARALTALSVEYRKNWSTAALSRLAGYSESYFIHRFRAAAGTSPHQYLIACRMKAALTLLRTGQTVSETADAVGYPELKAFSRAFHRWYGFPPSDVSRQTGSPP